MFNGFLLILKGFLIGFSLIIPGVSGGTMAMVLGIYERIISILSNIFKKIKENIIFILLLGIGVAFSILLGAIILEKAFELYVIPTILLFSGLIIGGMPMLLKKIKTDNAYKKPVNYIFMIITILIVILFTILNGNPKTDPFNTINFQTFLILLLLGFIASGTMIIPGISGSLVLMILGYYDAILNIITDITNFSNLGHNISIICIFLIGVAIGIVVFAKLINYLLNKYEIKTFFAIIGFVIASIFGIFYQSISKINVSGWMLFVHIFIGIILFCLGMVMTYKLGKIDMKNKENEENTNSNN